MAAQGRPPGADGWVCVTSADVDVDAELELWLEKTHELRSWLKRIGKSFDEVRNEGIPLPDSLSKIAVPTDPTDTMTGLTEPVDFKLYGFSPYGQNITAILPYTSRSFTRPLAEDGTFVIGIPEEFVEIDDNLERPVFLAIVTDNSNQQLSVTGFTPFMPAWIAARHEARAREWLQSLIGSRVEDLSFPQIGGQGRLRFTSHLGRVILVNTWATWCGPCIREMPALEAIYPDLAALGVTMLSLNYDDKPQTVTEFIEENGAIPYPVYGDPKRTFLSNFPVSLPTTAVIDRKGVYRFLHMGPLTEDEFRSALQTAM